METAKEVSHNRRHSWTSSTATLDIFQVSGQIVNPSDYLILWLCDLPSKCVEGDTRPTGMQSGRDPTARLTRWDEQRDLLHHSTEMGLQLRDRFRGVAYLCIMARNDSAPPPHRNDVLAALLPSLSLTNAHEGLPISRRNPIHDCDVEWRCLKMAGGPSSGSE